MSNRLFKALKIKKDNYHLRYELAGADETIKILGEKYSDLNKKYQLYKKAFELACEELFDSYIGYYSTTDCEREFLELAKEKLKGKKNDR